MLDMGQIGGADVDLKAVHRLDQLGQLGEAKVAGIEIRLLLDQKVSATTTDITPKRK